MSSIVTEAWQGYLLQLQKNPLRTKAITAGVLAGISDSVAQKISGIKKLQFRRLLLLMLYGFAYAGPFGHFLHKLMDRIFKGKKGNTTVAKKVLLEQLTSSPWNNLFFMMYYGLVVEGRRWSLVKAKVRKDYPTIQLTAWRGNLSESESKISEGSINWFKLKPFLYFGNCRIESISFWFNSSCNCSSSVLTVTQMNNSTRVGAE
uniref:Peroxisomal membrane protein PMP22 n=1 Tax=Cucumis melo TaxID=3656 RepID=A0A9I9DSF3_CUCME